MIRIVSIRHQVSELGDRDHDRHDGGRDQQMLDVEAVAKIAGPVFEDLRPATALGLAIDFVDVDRVSDLFGDLVRVALFGVDDGRIERFEFVLVVVVGSGPAENRTYLVRVRPWDSRAEGRESRAGGNLYLHCGAVCV